MVYPVLITAQIHLLPICEGLRDIMLRLELGVEEEGFGDMRHRDDLMWARVDSIMSGSKAFVYIGYTYNALT